MAKLKDVAEGRWSGYAIMGLEDAEVVYWRGEADYQGSCEYIVKIDTWGSPEYVEFAWSYGSCSYCDGYEDMSENERIKVFVNGRNSYSKDTLRVYGQNMLRENPDPDDDYGWSKPHQKALAILAETAKDDED